MKLWSKLAIGGLLIAAGMWMFAPLAHALEITPAPSLDRPVVDQTGTLSADDITNLSNLINTSRAKKDYQLGILIISTLGNDESLEGYSLKVARQWGIGTADKDNGVLLMIAKDDRKVRIEVGRGLEGDLTDVESSRIIRNVIAPNFRNGNYMSGITKAVESITAQVEGRTDPNAKSSTRRSINSVDIWDLAIFGIIWIVPVILSWLGAVLGRSRSWWLGGVIGGGVGVTIAAIFGWALIAVVGAFALVGLGLLLDFHVSKNYKKHITKGDDPSWWAGGGFFGGGGSGGGFSGGGSGGGFSGGGSGGGFSGGGSSGGW